MMGSMSTKDRSRLVRLGITAALVAVVFAHATASALPWRNHTHTHGPAPRPKAADSTVAPST